MTIGFESGVAVALALDACTVTLAIAIVMGGLTARQTFRLVWHFALFQAMMPVLGWAGGRFVEEWIRSWDHWLAFGLLVVVGGRMVFDGLRVGQPSTSFGDPTRGWSLVILSVATSIDALAVGLSIGVLDQPIWRPAALIGGITAAMTYGAAVFGRRINVASAQRAGIVGGSVLILLGCRVVFEHLSNG